MKKILIIEDEEVLANVLSAKLTKVGYDVKISVNGEDGLAKINEWNPDIILLDIIMPKMNGYEVMENLQKKNNKIPIIIISNSGQPVELEKIKKLGAIDYMIKAQIDVEEIVEKVKNVLSESEDINIKKEEISSVLSKSEDINIKKEDGSNEGTKVLLVEDDSFLSNILLKKLKIDGFNVFIVDDGAVVIKKIEEFAPLIVLLDIILPSMNGFEILEKIRSHQNNAIKNLPVIMLTNLGEEEDRKKALSLGANDFLIKANFTADEIAQKIKLQLNLK
ncbi:MAG: response regulator [Candidatus Paceibacterota bacterium]